MQNTYTVTYYTTDHQNRTVVQVKADSYSIDFHQANFLVGVQKIATYNNVESVVKKDGND